MSTEPNRFVESARVKAPHATFVLTVMFAAPLIALLVFCDAILRRVLGEEDP